MKEFITKDKLKDKQGLKKTKNIKAEPVEKKEEDEKPKQRPSKKQRIDVKRKVRVEKLRQNKKQLDQNLAAAQSSTKSVGRFDRKAHAEQKEHKVKRRKQYSNFTSIDEQLIRNKEIFALVRQTGVKKLQHPI